VHVDQDALITLTQGSLEKTQSIQQLEEAAAELYKALQAGRDTGMSDTLELLHSFVNSITPRRYGGYDGTITGVSDTQFSVLQENV
jgi:hypothetical protein